MERSAKVLGVCAITVLGLTVALLYHGYVGHVLAAGYPSNTFLYDPAVRFSDYFNIFGPVQQGHPLSNPWCPYFPFAYLALYAVAWLTPTQALAVTVGLFTASILSFFWQKLAFMLPTRRVLATAILTFATYPFVMCVDRGNLEMVVLIFTLGFFTFYKRGNYLLAAVLLASATAMKLYPGVFFVLLLWKREYKACTFAIIVTLLLTVIMAAALPDGLVNTIKLTSRNIRFFTEHMALRQQSIQGSSTYFSILKILVYLLNQNTVEVMREIRPFYVVACFIIFWGVSIYILWFEEVMWKQVSLLTFVMILLTDVSFDYKLVHVIIPVGLFLSEAAGSRREDVIYTILFGLLLIPKAYGVIGQAITIGVILNPLIMTLLAGSIIYTGVCQGQRRAAQQAPPVFSGGD